jgi:hypothetical protein
MPPINKNFIIFILSVILLSCSDTYINHVESPIPVNREYNGVMKVRKTGAGFAKTQIPRTRFAAGNYKIILFPKTLEIKSYYVKADAEGTIEVAYKLAEEIAVELGYEGTIFGILQITNESHSEVLHVPVGYLP